MEPNIWDLLFKLKKQEENKIKVDNQIYLINQKAKETQLHQLFLLEVYHILAQKTALLHSSDKLVKLTELESLKTETLEIQKDSVTSNSLIAHQLMQQLP